MGNLSLRAKKEWKNTSSWIKTGQNVFSDSNFLWKHSCTAYNFSCGWKLWTKVQHCENAKMQKKFFSHNQLIFPKLKHKNKFLILSLINLGLVKIHLRIYHKMWKYSDFKCLLVSKLTMQRFQCLLEEVCKNVIFLYCGVFRFKICFFWRRLIAGQKTYIVFKILRNTFFYAFVMLKH